MFGRKNKEELKELKRRLENAFELLRYSDKRIKALENPEKKSFNLLTEDELRISRLEFAIVSLRQPQKFTGNVYFKGKKYEVLESALREKESPCSKWFKIYERFYTLVYREGKELKQITCVREDELSKLKK